MREILVVLAAVLASGCSSAIRTGEVETAQVVSDTDQELIAQGRASCISQAVTEHGYTQAEARPHCLCITSVFVQTLTPEAKQALGAGRPVDRLTDLTPEEAGERFSSQCPDSEEFYDTVFGQP